MHHPIVDELKLKVAMLEYKITSLIEAEVNMDSSPQKGKVE